MDFDALTIAFSVNNTAVVEISGEAGFRRCINNQTLTRKTTVTVYRDDEPGAAMPAGQVPELAVLFDEILGAPVARKSPPPKSAPEPKGAEETAPDAEHEPEPKAESEKPPLPTQLKFTSVPAQKPSPVTPPASVAKETPAAPTAAPKPATPSVSPSPSPSPSPAPPKLTSPANPPGPQSPPSPQTQTKPKSGSGCLTWLVILAVVWAVFWWATHHHGGGGLDHPLTYRVPAGRTNVNVRVEPDPHSKQVGRPLVPGETFVVLEHVTYEDKAHGVKTPWLKIKFRDGETGYVRESLVEEAPSKTPTSPAPASAAPSANPKSSRMPHAASPTELGHDRKPAPAKATAPLSQATEPRPKLKFADHSADRLPPVSATPAATPQAPPPITRPVWRQWPTVAQSFEVTPKDFLSEDILGRIVMDCQVDANGLLSACRPVSEAPAGRGLVTAFGRLLPYYRMASADGDGQPTAGRHYRLSISLGVKPQT